MNYSDNILQAIEAMLGTTLANQKNVKVFEANILSLADASIGLYKIKYLNQTLKAYTNNISVQYNEDDSVYVLSQDGTLDGNLVIIGSSAPYSGLYQNENDTQYRPVSGSIINSIAGGIDIGLCTYQSTQYINENDGQPESLTLDLGDNFAAIFSHYLLAYKTFCLQMNVKTNILDTYQKQKGNYGLVITIPFVRTIDGIDAQETKTYTFDINDMEGTVYDFDTKTAQRKYITFEDDLKYDPTRDISIYAFCKDFKQNIEITEPDIFLSDFGFYPVEVLDPAVMAGTYLMLTATQGNYFINGRFSPTKEIIPTLFINGKEVNYDGCDCYWFVEDSSVTMNSAVYNNKGGVGWRCLNEYSTVDTSEGKTSTVLILNNYRLKVSQSDVQTSLRYKCILVYNNELVKQDILLENLDSNIDISLELVSSREDKVLATDALATLSCVVTLKESLKIEDGHLEYVWNRYNPTNTFIDNDFYSIGRNNNTFTQIDTTTSSYRTDIDFKGSIITDDYNLVTCTVFLVKTNNDRICWGTAKKVISVLNPTDFYISMSGVNKLYKYDADGNSPMVAEYDGPISSIIHEIEPISYKLYKASGEEFTESEYKFCTTEWLLPRNSMMTFEISKLKNQFGVTVVDDVKVDPIYYHVRAVGKFDINYTIANIFNHNKMDNAVQVSVRLDSANTLKAVADIQFLKDGESGTNGTKFSAILTYNGLGYNVLNAKGLRQKLHFVYIADKETGNGKWYVKSPNSNLMSDLTLITSSGLTPRGSDKSTLGVELYKDGELAGPDAIYSVTWTMFDEQATKPYITIDNNGIIKLAAENQWKSALDEIKIAVIQANIKVTDTSNNNANQIIYVYYPIEMTRIYDVDKDNLKYVPTIDDGFYSVLYSTDGTNPKWDKTSPFVMNNYLQINPGEDEVFDYFWGASKNLSVKVDKDDSTKCTATPTPKYDNGYANNYVYTRMVASVSGVEGLQQKLSDKENEAKAEYEKIAKELIKQIELKNLSTTFDSYYGEGGEAEYNRLKKAISDAETAYSSVLTMFENVTKKYETDIAKFEDNEVYSKRVDNSLDALNNYVKEINKNTKDYFNATKPDDKQSSIEFILLIQNPVNGGWSYSSVYDGLNSAINTKNNYIKIMKRGVVEGSEEETEINTLVAALETDGVTSQIYKDKRKAYLDKHSNMTYAILGLEAGQKNYLEQKNRKDTFETAFGTLIAKISVEDLLDNFEDIFNTEKIDVYNYYNNSPTFSVDYKTLTDSKQALVDKDNLEKNYKQVAETTTTITIPNAEQAIKDAEQSLKDFNRKKISELNLWVKTLNKDAFLDNRQNVLLFLQKAETALKYLYSELGKINKNDFSELITEVATARALAYSTIGSLTPVPDYPLAKITLSEAKEQEYYTEGYNVDLDGYGLLTDIKNYIKNYNDSVDQYTESLKKLKTLSKDNVNEVYSRLIEFAGKESILINETIDGELVLNYLLLNGIETSLAIASEIADAMRDIVGDKEITAFNLLLKADSNTFNPLYQSLLSVIDSMEYSTNWSSLEEDKKIISKDDYRNNVFSNFISIVLNKFYIISGTIAEDNIKGQISDNGITLELISTYSSVLVENVEEEIENIDVIYNEIDSLSEKIKAVLNQISCIHVKPIVFRTNTYEFSWLNGWDGNKLYIDEDEEYILSPQIGAGAKNEANQFIGITMGVKQSNKGTDSQIGLFGFSEKGQSIFLDAKTGKAEFGVAGKGQINLDPTVDRAMLYSGNFFEHNSDGTVNYERETGEGLLIDLTTPEIRFGNGGFWVDKDGNMHVGGNDNVEVDASHDPGGEPNSPEYEPKDEIIGDVYRHYDGLEWLTYINEENKYISKNEKELTYDPVNNIFTDGTNNYNIVNSITAGVPAIHRKKEFGEYVYYYYDGSDEYELILLSGCFSGIISSTNNGLKEPGVTIYLDPSNAFYWIYKDGLYERVYLNLDMFHTHAYYNEDELYYYFYDKDDNEVRYFYDANLGVYLTYNSESNQFYFIDEEDDFGGGKNQTWIWEPETNRYFYFDGLEKVYMNTKDGNDLGGWRIGSDSIYSENEKMKLYSSFGNPEGEPFINGQTKKTAKHDSLSSTAEGFYLAPSGISVSNSLRVSSAIEDKYDEKGRRIFAGLSIGNIDGGKYWRVYGTKNHSYIYYSATEEKNQPSSDSINLDSVGRDSQNNKIYLGTDGIQFANQMRVYADSGKILLGDLTSDGKYWLVHNKNKQGFIYHSSKDPNNDRNHATLALSGENEESFYLGTDGIRLGGIFKARIDNHDYGYLELGDLSSGAPGNVYGSHKWYFSRANWGDDSGKITESFFYTKRTYGGGAVDVAKMGASLTANWGMDESGKPKGIVAKNDIYIGTDGIRIGNAMYADNFKGDRSEMVFRFIAANTLVGVVGADGSTEWIPFDDYAGGGGGNLPRAEDYSF